MPKTGNEPPGSSSCIKEMLGELKELLERRTHAQTENSEPELSDAPAQPGEANYFTFMGSQDESSVSIGSPIERKYHSDRLRDFFKIRDEAESSLSAKFSGLRLKASQSINGKLKTKITDKISRL